MCGGGRGTQDYRDVCQGKPLLLQYWHGPLDDEDCRAEA